MALRRGQGLAILAAVALALAGAACSRPAMPPNVLFVLLDDLRWDMVGSYGNPHVRTPRLDALAAEGLSLDAFYVASPVCVASRISFLTGRYMIEDGIRTRPRAKIDDDMPTVAGFFAEAGYRTGFIGKAHATDAPWTLGFEDVPLYHVAHRVGVRYEKALWLRHRGQAPPERVSMDPDPTRGLVDAAIDWIETRSERPWFLWLATTAPHFPYVPHEEHPYPVEELRAPPGHSDEPAFVPRDEWSRYHSQISWLDAELGRLFDALDRLGLRDDTLVIVTSDNGLLLGSHGVATKGVWFEEAVRQPWIARWPGVVAPGSRSDGLVSSVDFLPTMLDLLEREPDRPYEGSSQLSLLRGGESSRGHVYSLGMPPKAESRDLWLMVARARRKFVRFEGSGEQLYFDRAADPKEQSPRTFVSDFEPLSRSLDEWLERWEGQNRRLVRRLKAEGQLPADF